MSSRINIVIPSIELSEELIYCLKKLSNQTYKNFFVTIVLDFNNKKKLPKLKYKLNRLISDKKNMSYKRNLGVKKFQSDLIAFLDSDAYPHKNWLKTAEGLLSKKKILILYMEVQAFHFQNKAMEKCYVTLPKDLFMLQAI